MYDFVGAYIFERAMWALIATVVLIALAFMFWNSARTIREKLRESREQVARLEMTAETLKQTIHDLEGRQQTQLEAIESALSQLRASVAEAQRETQDVEKHVGALETKTDVSVATVDTIKHQVDVDVGELRRIDEQVKTSIGRIDRNARHIDRLEVEVHSLVPGVRTTRDRHLD